MAAPKSFGALHVADAVVAFAKAHPRLRVSLILEDVPFSRSYDFVERGLDVALRLSSLRNAAVVERPIAALDWLVCAAPEYLAREGRPATPADLAHHACLVHVHVAANDRIWRFEGPKGPVSAKVAGAFFSNSALALRKAAVAGLGVALLPGYVVDDDIAAGTLVPALPRHKVAARPLLAAYPRSRAVAQKVETFVDFLKVWITTRDVDHRVARPAGAARR